jgi:hypothetical protein
MRVLIVEDGPMAEAIRDGLRLDDRRGIAAGGATALELLRSRL